MSLLESAKLSCPYCGESINITVDTSAGSQEYIEDCQVCCQPIEMRVEINAGGTLESIQAHRQDT